MKQRLGAAAAAAMLCAGPAMAQGYLAAGVGWTQIDIDGCSGRCDDSDTGYKLVGGYGLSGALAAELSYFDYGQASERGTINGNPYRARVDATGWGLGLAYRVDLSPTWDATLRLGIARNRAKLSGSFGGLSGRDSETRTRPYFGLGVAYKLSPTMAVGLDMDLTSFKYEGESENARLIGASMRIGF